MFIKIPIRIDILVVGSLTNDERSSEAYYLLQGSSYLLGKYKLYFLNTVSRLLK